MTRIVKPKIHESRLLAGVPPARLNGIDVHTRAGIAEHKFLRSSILLEHHQFLEDDVVHGNSSSPAGLTFGDENCASEKVHVLPLQSENLSAPHPCIKSNCDDGANVISPAGELRKQLLLFLCSNEPLPARTLLQQAHPPHRIRVDQFIVKSH